MSDKDLNGIQPEENNEEITHDENEEQDISQENQQADDSFDKSPEPYKTEKPKKEKKPLTPHQKSMYKRIALIGAMFLCLVLIIGISYMHMHRQPDDMKISVKTSDNFSRDGIAVIKGVGFYDDEYLMKNLTFVPAVDFSINRLNADEVEVVMKKFKNTTYAGELKYTDDDGIVRKELFKVNGPLLTVDLDTKNVETYSTITLKFNEQVDIRSLKDNLTMTPYNDFEMSYDVNYVYLNPPENGWDTSSQYRISIGSDYKSAFGKQFNKNQVISFPIVERDENGIYHKYSSYPEVFFKENASFIVTEDVDLSLDFATKNLKDKVALTVETYFIGDAEKFKKQSDIYLNYDIPIDTLTKVDTNAYLLEEGDNTLKVKNPGEGAYLLKISYKDPRDGETVREIRTGYLVTPYSLYVQSSAGETLVWVHNSQEGIAQSGYTVRLKNETDTKEEFEYTAVTDEQGLALMQHEPREKKVSQNEDYYYPQYIQPEIVEMSLLDEDGNLVYYDNASLRTNSSPNQEVFYSYLYLDRSLYRPEDTINFWGYVSPFRTNTRELPDTAIVVLDEGGLDIRVEADINENGVFTGEIEIEKLRSSDYSIKSMLVIPRDAELGDKDDTQYVLDYEYVSIKEFEKPAYVIETSVDKKFYSEGEDVKVTIVPTFYDGTPLPFYPLEFSYMKPGTGDWEEVSGVTTDGNGIAEVTFPAIADIEKIDYYYGGLENGYYRASIATDGEQISNMGDYNYYPNNTLIDAVITKDKAGENLKMEINTYSVNLKSPEFLKQVEESEYLYQVFEMDNMLKIAKGDPVDASFNVGLRWLYRDNENIVHENRRSNQEGQYIEFENNYSFDYKTYDWTKNKLNIKDNWETLEKMVRVSSENGKAVINDLIYLPENSHGIDFDKDVYCRANITYKDNLGVNQYEYVYYPKMDDNFIWDYYDDVQKPKGLTFKITDLDAEKDLTPRADYYRRAMVNADSTINFEVLKDGETITDIEGTILYSVIQGGLYEHKIVSGNTFDFNYGVEYGPNITVMAAYFDGYRVHYISTIELVAENESLNIDIEVTPDKESYKPGDTVTLDVKSTDYKGRGVSGNMVVSVVDEAIFALSEQYVFPLGQLYDKIMYRLDNYVARYCTTYRDGGANAGIWSGGKGDSDGAAFYDSYRENFKDTAFFKAIRTDSSGNAKVTFELPDNTTSWRITTVEIGDNMRVGNSQTNIISTLPFFVRPVISTKYIDGDDISMLVQGHGVILDTDSEIDYTVRLFGDGFDQTLTSKGKSYQPWEFNFGKLPIGSYFVEAKAQYSGYSDTVKLPVNIMKSNLELVVNKPIEVKQGEKLDIEAVRYPVTLTVYDRNHQGFVASINSLFGHYCMAPNQRMSRFVAKRVIRDNIQDGEIPYYIAEGNDSAADMQQSDGGIGPYAVSESEILLSCYMTLIAEDQFNHAALTDYLERHATTQSDEKKQAAAYLALAKLDEVKPEVIKKKLSDSENMRVDVKAYYVAALAYLGETKEAKEIYNSELKKVVKDVPSRQLRYWDFTEADIISERDAAAVWIAASLLDEQDADELSLHFANFSWRYRTLFEAMIYVTNYSREIVQHSYSYTMEGKTNTVKLSLNGMSTMTLSKSKLESLVFTDMPDELDVIAYYIGEPSEIDIVQSENMKVSKTVKAENENTYAITITLDLAEDAPRGTYDISDWVPSNCRLYRSSENMENEGQKVYISYYHTGGGGKATTKKFTYYVRQTYQGEAVLDTVYVIHGESGENCTYPKSVFVPENPTIATPMVHIDPEKSHLDIERKNVNIEEANSVEENVEGDSESSK